jgi:hypothetical protein
MTGWANCDQNLTDAGSAKSIGLNVFSGIIQYRYSRIVTVLPEGRRIIPIVSTMSFCIQQTVFIGSTKRGRLRLSSTLNLPV